jgi:hypothetical protein
MIPRVRPPHDPQRLEALFDDVWSEVLLVETGLALLLALSRDRRASGALHTAAPKTFHLLGAALTEVVLLRTHRLLEPGARRGRRTASIETLLADLLPKPHHYVASCGRRWRRSVPSAASFPS